MASFVLYFKHLRNEHITKDVGFVPSFMQKFYDVEIATKSKQINFPNLKFNFVNIVSINSFFSYLLKKKPDILMFFHINRYSFFNCIFAKVFLRKLKIYIKSDYGPSQVRGIEKMNFFRKLIHLYSINLFLVFVDVLTFEDIFVFRFMKQNLYFKKKIHHLPNGFAPVLSNLKLKKNNQIITVSDLNNPKKRTIDLLKLVSEMKHDLKDWKFIFVGNYDLIKTQVDELIKREKLSSLVRFTGPILDRNKLNVLYAQSKIFVLYSVKEGFPNVFTEAGFFGNVVVSTDEGGSRDITLDGTCGGLCLANDPECMKKNIIFYLNNPAKLKIDQEKTRNNIIKNHNWKTLTKKLYYLLN